jgi:hypothetical protein
MRNVDDVHDAGLLLSDDRTEHSGATDSAFLTLTNPLRSGQGRPSRRGMGGFAFLGLSYLWFFSSTEEILNG